MARPTDGYFVGPTIVSWKLYRLTGGALVLEPGYFFTSGGVYYYEVVWQPDYTGSASLKNTASSATFDMLQAPSSDSNNILIGLLGRSELGGNRAVVPASSIGLPVQSSGVPDLTKIVAIIDVSYQSNDISITQSLYNFINTASQALYGNISPSIFGPKQSLKLTGKPTTNMGKVAYWNGGAYLPKGSYVIQYVGGALKYNSTRPYQLNDFGEIGDTPIGYRIVAGTQEFEMPLPRVPFASPAAIIAAGYGSGNVGIRFLHQGGPIGMYLFASDYESHLAPNGGGVYDVPPSFSMYVEQTQWNFQVDPQITTDIVDKVVASGSAVAFIVVARGTGGTAYQWYKNGSAISGSTGQSLLLFNVTKSDTAIYQVSVTGSGGTVWSSKKMLFVKDSSLTQVPKAYMAQQDTRNVNLVTLWDGSSVLAAAGAKRLTSPSLARSAFITASSQPSLLGFDLDSVGGGVHDVQQFDLVANTAADLYQMDPAVVKDYLLQQPIALWSGDGITQADALITYDWATGNFILRYSTSSSFGPDVAHLAKVSFVCSDPGNGYNIQGFVVMGGVVQRYLLGQWIVPGIGHPNGGLTADGTLKATYPNKDFVGINYIHADSPYGGFYGLTRSGDVYKLGADGDNNIYQITSGLSRYRGLASP